MQKFSHINAFYQVCRYVDHVNADPECPEQHKVRTPVTYRGTVKLHGTNTGVECTPKGLVPQSRTRVISVGDDNKGFAAFVARPETAAAIREIEGRIRRDQQVGDDTPVVLFGEWIGPGIQKGTAVNQLPVRQWVIFAVALIVGEGEEQTKEYIDAVPFLPWSHYAEFGLFSVLSAPNYSLTVDFSDQANKRRSLEYVTQVTADVGAQCPWGDLFEIEGIGEGIVWVPTGLHWGNSNLFFKSKDERHKVTKSKSDKPQLAPEVLQSIQEFVAFAVTENRLRQGLEALKETGTALDISAMGQYLKWVQQDVQRECALELEDNQLDWKVVSKEVNLKARSFFLELVQRV